MSMTLIFPLQQATDFVENVLEVHTKYRKMIGDVFQGDQARI